MSSDIDTVGCVDSQARSSSVAIIASKSTNNQIVPTTKRKQNLSSDQQIKSSSSTTDLTVASLPNKMPGSPTKSVNNQVTHSKSQQVNTVRQIPPRTGMHRGPPPNIGQTADDHNVTYQSYQYYAPVSSYNTSPVTVPVSISSPHIGTQPSNYHSQYNNYSHQMQIQQPNSKHSNNDMGNRQNYSNRQNSSNKKMYNSNYTKKRNGNYNNNNNNNNSNNSNTSSSSNNNNNNYSKNNNNNNNEYQRNMANKSAGHANQPITRSGHHRSYNSDTSKNISPSRDHYSSSSSSSSSSSVPMNKKRDSRTTPTAYAHERDVSYLSHPWPHNQYVDSVPNPMYSYEWLRASDGYYPAGRLPSHQQHITYSDPSTGEFITVTNTNIADGKSNYRVGKTNRLNPKSNINSVKRYTPPDRFMNRAPHVEIKETPLNLTNGTKWDRLSIQVWDKFMKCQQKEKTYMKKIKMWKNMYCSVQESFSDYSLYMVGSTISGFGSDVSDVDMCLVDSTKTSPVYFGNDLRVHSAKILNDFKELLDRSAIYGEFNLILAKVPILRFKDTFHEFEIDLNYNNYVGVQNTHLMYCYGRMDWRLRPLALVVKIWAQYHGINNAKEMTISSYSLVLMVIHFLQCAVSPPVLPCLHDLYPSKFQKQQEIKSIDMHEDLAPWFSQNKQSLGELFFQFFEYYTKFDFTTKAISVRRGCAIPIESCKTNNSPKNDPNQWKELCIEEPFDFTNTAHSCYDPHKFQWIRRVFTVSYEALFTTRDLKSILSL